MRTFLLAVFLVFAATTEAQTFLSGNYLYSGYRGSLVNPQFFSDSTNAQKKWTFTRYTALSTSYTFFKGGQASVVSAPIGLQLNRKLNSNLYAFANAVIAPAYISFNRSFMAADVNKSLYNNGLLRKNRFGAYSSASLGLMYLNDDKTFSVSGSISVERNSYPMLPYYAPVQRQNAAGLSR